MQVDVAAAEESLVGVGAADAKPMAATRANVEVVKSIMALEAFLYIMCSEDIEVEKFGS